MSTSAATPGGAATTADNTASTATGGQAAPSRPPVTYGQLPSRPTLNYTTLPPEEPDGGGSPP